MELEHEHLRLRRCRHGAMLSNVRDRYIGGSLDRYGEFSEGEVALFRQVLAPGMTVVEAGANTGAHTMALARLVGPNGRVLALKPQRVVFQMLCANLALNGFEQVEAHWAGLGRAPGRPIVPQPDYRRLGNFGRVELAEDGPGEAVAVVPLDSLELAACHLIKADVDGMEAEVLAGAARTIARHRPVLYLENDRAERSAALLPAVFALGYRVWWHLPPLFNAANFAGARENAYPRIVSGNLFCAPREAAPAVAGAVEVTDPEAGLPFAEA